MAIRQLLVFVLISGFGSAVVELERIYPPKDVTDQPISEPGLHDMLLRGVQDTAAYLGFGVKCQNFGHKTAENDCVCPRFFTGKECETRLCANGGKVVKLRGKGGGEECQCPDPDNIHGAHCEKVKCMHGGELVQHATNGSWNCNCMNTKFYTGKYCQDLLIPLTWIVVVCLMTVVVAVFCICRSNWFQSSNNNRYSNNRCTAVRVEGNGYNNPRTSRSHTNELLSSERGQVRRTAAYPEGVVRPNFVRLDTIPAFNPRMIGGVEPNNRTDMPVEPPPTYDQAITLERMLPPVYTAIDNGKTDE